MTFESKPILLNSLEIMQYTLSNRNWRVQRWPTPRPGMNKKLVSLYNYDILQMSNRNPLLIFSDTGKYLISAYSCGTPFRLILTEKGLHQRVEIWASIFIVEGIRTIFVVTSVVLYQYVKCFGLMYQVFLGSRSATNTTSRWCPAATRIHRLSAARIYTIRKTGYIERRHIIIQSVVQQYVLPLAKNVTSYADCNLIVFRNGSEETNVAMGGFRFRIARGMAKWQKELDDKNNLPQTKALIAPTFS